MKKLEERIERQGKELQKMREDLAKTEALAPKIAELSASFGLFRANQLKINLVTGFNVTQLQSTMRDDLGPRLGSINHDLVLLKSRYAMLHAITSGLLATQTREILAKPPPATFLQQKYPNGFLPPSKAGPHIHYPFSTPNSVNILPLGGSGGQ